MRCQLSHTSPNSCPITAKVFLLDMEDNRVRGVSIKLGLSLYIMSHAQTQDGQGTTEGELEELFLKQTQVAQPLLSKAVELMAKDDGVQNAKLFHAEEFSMSTLTGSGIETMVVVFNNQLAEMSDCTHVLQWVRKNVTFYNSKGVDSIQTRNLTLLNSPSWYVHVAYNSNTFVKDVRQYYGCACHFSKHIHLSKRL